MINCQCRGASALNTQAAGAPVAAHQVRYTHAPPSRQVAARDRDHDRPRVVPAR